MKANDLKLNVQVKGFEEVTTQLNKAVDACKITEEQINSLSNAILNLNQTINSIFIKPISK